jgi:hypothetical protein
MKDWLPDFSKAWERGENIRKDVEHYLTQVQRDMEKMFTDLRRGFDFQMEEASKFIKRFHLSMLARMKKKLLLK